MIKMRLFTSVIASAIFLAASAASALTTFNVTTDRVADGTGTIVLNPGDTLTISIRLSGGTNVFGMGASAFGYSESVIDFTSGQAVSSINHAVAIPVVGFFSGLGNALVAAPVPGTVGTGPLSESAIGANGNRVNFFSGVGLTGTNSNPLDPGLNGSAADAQFRIVFTAGGEGLSVINIGTGYAGDGEVGTGGSLDQSANVQLRVSVIPEPGTALLMGLGLAGLAAAGRRE
jgi:PEP-CTERM motif